MRSVIRYINEIHSTQSITFTWLYCHTRGWEVVMGEHDNEKGQREIGKLGRRDRWSRGKKKLRLGGKRKGPLVPLFIWSGTSPSSCPQRHSTLTLTSFKVLPQCPCRQERISAVTFHSSHPFHLMNLCHLVHPLLDLWDKFGFLMTGNQ